MTSKPSKESTPTLGVVELSSIPKGLLVCDLMLKKAQVRLLRASALGCGKFLITLTGDEGSLLEAVEEGRAAAGPYLVASTYLPNIHPQVIRALSGKPPEDGILDAVGALEAHSLATLIRAADVAAKTAVVRLLELTFDLDLGGKGYFTLTGALSEVEAALEAAERFVLSEGHHVHREIIARPHEGMDEIVLGK
jgi:microcompartment protein CcmL/EutN